MSKSADEKRNSSEATAMSNASMDHQHFLEKTYSHTVKMCRLGYTGLYFCRASFTPYIPLLLAAKGFKPDEIGWIVAALPASLIFLLPPLSYLADKTRKATPFALGAMLLSSLLVLILDLSTSMTIVGTVAVLNAIAMTPVASLFDQHCMALIPESKKTEWGQHRVFGAYGWGVGAPLASLILSHFGWSVMWVQYLIGHVAACYAMVATPITAAATKKRYRDVLLLVLKNARMCLFLFCTCMLGTGYVLVVSFLFLYLQEELHAPELLLGISVTCTVVVEVPLFRASTKIHSMFSDKTLLCVAMVGWSVRVWGYSLLQNPWHVLFLEPLHGLSFGLMWLSGVHYMSTSFPKDLTASAFGFIHTTAFGVGPMIGNVIGGHLYEQFGPRVMYRAAGTVMLCACGLFLFVDHWLMKTQKGDQQDDGEEPQAGAVVVDAQGKKHSQLRESPRHAEADDNEMPLDVIVSPQEGRRSAGSTIIVGVVGQRALADTDITADADCHNAEALMFEPVE